MQFIRKNAFITKNDLCKTHTLPVVVKVVAHEQGDAQKQREDEQGQDGGVAQTGGQQDAGEDEEDEHKVAHVRLGRLVDGVVVADLDRHQRHPKGAKRAEDGEAKVVARHKLEQAWNFIGK